MKRLLPAALAALALSLSACSDPSEAYTPVDELPSAQDQDRVDRGSMPEDTMYEPAPAEPLPPADPEIPPPMDPAPPIDEAAQPPPVDPTMDDEDPAPPAY